MDTRYDVIIIGAGPAGLTAGIYCARSDLKTLILEYDAPGGKLVKTAEIANWPGVTSMAGTDLALKMFDHISHLGVEYRYGEVSELTVEKTGFALKCKNGDAYSTRAVIIATGTKERMMDIPQEKEMIGRGVSYCAVCDGAFYKNEEVIVVGGGNAAVEEAIYLAQFVKSVKIVIRRDVFRADQSYVDELNANSKITIIKKHIPTAVITKDNRVSGLEVESVDNKTRQILNAKGIFPYIGSDPSTAFIKDYGITDEHGYLLVDGHMATKLPGIFGAGDVCAKVLRQVVTAAGDGATAAVSVSYYLK